MQGCNRIFDRFRHCIYFGLLGNVLATHNGINSGFYTGKVLVVILIQSICLGNGFINFGVISPLADDICVQQRGIFLANVLLQRIPILLCAAVIYGCQSSTIAKSKVFNARHTLWNGYFRQAAATLKSTLSNARHTFRNDCFCQAAATPKSKRSNARHTFRNRYFCQAAVIRKSPFSNLRYRLPAQLGRNVHLAVRAEITNKGRRVIRSLINHIAGQIAFV